VRWNSGANNWMVYGTGDIPVGDYSSTNLANIGIGHDAVIRKLATNFLR
jgi:hypothetical protein